MKLSEVYQEAAKGKKTKKGEAERIMLELSAKLDAEHIEAMGHLLRYFDVQPSAKAKADKQAWIEQAVSTDPTRAVLGAAYSDGETMVATDGRRLHAMPTKKGAGFYHRGVKIDKDLGTYPNWQQCVPAVNGQQTFAVDEGDIAPTHVTTKTKAVTKLFSVRGAYFNMEYIKEAMAGTGAATFYIEDDRSPVLIVGEDGRKAVIMPMRVADKVIAC